MTLIGLIILLVVIGVVIALVPIDPQYKRYILIVVGLFVLLVVLSWFGLIPNKIPLK